MAAGSSDYRLSVNVARSSATHKSSDAFATFTNITVLVLFHEDLRHVHVTDLHVVDGE